MAEMKGEISTFNVSEEEGMSVSRYIRAYVNRDRGLIGDPVALQIVFDNFKEAMQDVFGGKVDKESLEKGKGARMPRSRKA